jgi:hypothetical protein
MSVNALLGFQRSVRAEDQVSVAFCGIPFREL